MEHDPTTDTPAGPLAGLRVLDLSNSPAGAQASQTLADFGAEVVQVEPPGGSALRDLPSYPLICRGKKSMVLDLHDAGDAALAREMALGADVLIETFRPGVMERLGLGYDDLAAANPRLVYGSVTGFGRKGPYANAKAYEALVMARVGALWASQGMVAREGPAHVSVPYCSYGASQQLLTGICAALHERERSGEGQHVEATLVNGLASLGTWNWYLNVITSKFPDAFTPSSPFGTHGLPLTPMIFMLLIALEQGRPLAAILPGPAAPLHGDAQGDGPRLDAPGRGMEGRRVGSRHPEDRRVLGQALRGGPVQDPGRVERGLRERPQRLGRDDASGERAARPPADAASRCGRGDRRSPSAVSCASRGRSSRCPTRPPCSDGARRCSTPTGPPCGRRRGRHSAGRTWWPVQGRRRGNVRSATSPCSSSEPSSPRRSAARCCARWGVRVIKVEPMEGEPMRTLLPFPEVGAAKCMQGKESICVDLSTDEGREIVHALAQKVRHGAAVVPRRRREAPGRRRRHAAGDQP